MSLRLKQQLYHGILKMLSTVQTQAVQVNGIGELILQGDHDVLVVKVLYSGLKGKGV